MVTLDQQIRSLYEIPVPPAFLAAERVTTNHQITTMPRLFGCPYCDDAHVITRKVGAEERAMVESAYILMAEFFERSRPGRLAGNMRERVPHPETVDVENLSFTAIVR